MIKNRCIVLFLLIFGLQSYSVAQELSVQNYVIITFEDLYEVSPKVSPHGMQSYYWIINRDSIKSYDIVLSRLFVEGFSTNNLADCCNGKAIDPFVAFANSTYTFEPGYDKSLEELQQLITKNRKKLQTITKKWEFGHKQTTTIFATPVSGKFCSCNYHVIGQERTG